MNREVICFDAVAPARERGLKDKRYQTSYSPIGRSREGAWIESSIHYCIVPPIKVAPARERGLKEAQC